MSCTEFVQLQPFPECGFLFDQSQQRFPSLLDRLDVVDVHLEERDEGAHLGTGTGRRRTMKGIRWPGWKRTDGITHPRF